MVPKSGFQKYEFKNNVLVNVGCVLGLFLYFRANNKSYNNLHSSKNRPFYWRTASVEHYSDVRS